MFKIPANDTHAQDSVIKLRSDTFQGYQISPVEIIQLASTAFIEHIQADDEVTQTTCEQSREPIATIMSITMNIYRTSAECRVLCSVFHVSHALTQQRHFTNRERRHRQESPPELTCRNVKCFRDHLDLPLSTCWCP